MADIVTRIDGSSETFDLVDGYLLRNAQGAVVESRPLTGLERGNLTRLAAQSPRERARRLTLGKARQAYMGNAQFLALPDPAFPLSVAAQQALVNQVIALTRQMQAVIRLTVAEDFLDEETL